MRVELADGTDAFTADGDKMLTEMRGEKGRLLTISDLIQCYNAHSSIAQAGEVVAPVFKVLIDGLPASDEATVSAGADVTVTLLVNRPIAPADGKRLAFDAAGPLTYNYREDRPPRLHPWMRDSETAAIKGLLEAFGKQRSVASSGATDATTSEPPVPLAVVARFAKVIVVDQAGDLKKLMNETKTKIEKKQKKRAKKAAEREAAAAAAALAAENGTTVEPPSGPEPPAAIDHDTLFLGLLELTTEKEDGMLSAMGFEQNLIVRGMLENDLNPERAVNFILGLTDTSSLAGGLSNEQIEAFARRYLPEMLPPVTPASPAPVNSSMSRQQTGVGAIFEEDVESNSDDDEKPPQDPGVAQLVELGFPPDQAERALAEFRGNTEHAANALFEGRTFAAPNVVEGERFWTLRLQDRLLKLESAAAHADPPQEPEVTPDMVIETAAQLLNADNHDALRRTVVGRAVFRELEELFPPLSRDADVSPAEPTINVGAGAGAFNLGGGADGRSPEELLAALQGVMEEVGEAMGGIIEEDDDDNDGSDDSAGEGVHSSGGSDGAGSDGPDGLPDDVAAAYGIGSHHGADAEQQEGGMITMDSFIAAAAPEEPSGPAGGAAEEPNAPNGSDDGESGITLDD